MERGGRERLMNTPVVFVRCAREKVFVYELHPNGHPQMNLWHPKRDSPQVVVRDDSLIHPRVYKIMNFIHP